MKIIIFGAGIVRDLFILGLFFWFLYHGAEIGHLRTMFFALLGFKSLISIFSLRSLHQPIWRINPFSNPLLVGAVAVSLLLLVAAIYWPPLQGILSTVPLGINSWILIFIVGAMNIIMIEIAKHRFVFGKQKEN